MNKTYFLFRGRSPQSQSNQRVWTLQSYGSIRQQSPQKHFVIKLHQITHILFLHILAGHFNNVHAHLITDNSATP